MRLASSVVSRAPRADPPLPWIGRRQYNDAVPLDAGSPPLVAAVRGLGAALREVGYPAAAQHPRDMTRQWRPGVASYDADRIAELGATALGVVVTAFELQRPVPRAALEAALPGVDLDALLAGGFLEPAGPDAVRTTIGIQACDGVLALADPSRQGHVRRAANGC